jgi:L-fuconolactonase
MNAESGTRNAEQQGGIIDTHVHFWNPEELDYPWLRSVPALDRAFLPSDYAAATDGIAITQLVFVECNCRPEEAPDEVGWVERLAQVEPRIVGIVAYADVADSRTLAPRLAALAGSPRVKGVRQNIQGEPAGFCRRRLFVEGVRQVGRQGLTFDLCVTHDQLSEVIELVCDCPDTRFVLDHCGKPAIRDRCLEPWSRQVRRLASHENVCCKLSGLLTEAADGCCDEDLVPYAARVVECFGTERVMYGSDWPVLTLAGKYGDWYGFTERFASGWSASERRHFYADNAIRIYGL